MYCSRFGAKTGCCAAQPQAMCVLYRGFGRGWMDGCFGKMKCRVVAYEYWFVRFLLSKMRENMVCVETLKVV